MRKIPPYTFLGYMGNGSKGVTILERFDIMLESWFYDCNYVSFTFCKGSSVVSKYMLKYLYRRKGV